MEQTNRNILQDQAAWCESFTPDQWMQTVSIKELWVFSITIWKQLNSELHGTDGAISMEQRRKETATEAVAVYQSTIGS
jgi:hypothetical protein